MSSFFTCLWKLSYFTPRQPSLCFNLFESIIRSFLFIFLRPIVQPVVQRLIGFSLSFNSAYLRFWFLLVVTVLPLSVFDLAILTALRFFLNSLLDGAQFSEALRFLFTLLDRLPNHPNSVFRSPGFSFFNPFDIGELR